MRKLLLCICVLTAFTSLNAEILMPKIFSDNMVLQRQMPVKIWGRADANSNVKVEFANQSKEAKADSSGSWALYLDEMPANSTNQNMKVYENGALAKEFKDILVGEVWVAGGQSNMVRAFSHSKQIDTIGDRATNPKLRMFSQSISLWKGFNPLLDKNDLSPNFEFPQDAKWNLSNKTNTLHFGEVAFYFAERLVDELNVPVAIIQTPMGGSKMISWLAREDLSGIESYEDGLKTFDTALANFNPNAPKKAIKTSKRGEVKDIGLGWYRESPSLMYNTKIAPLAGFTARGFIWYQGESDAGNPDFAVMFERLVRSWRKYWGNEKMPFVAVQLAAFENSKDWADTRWQQYLVAEKLDDVEILINIDTGQEDDIHPVDKDIVGARLGNLVLGEIYDLKKFDDYEFPLLDEVDYKGNIVEVEFDTESPLKLKGDFRGFEVLVDKTWQEAILVELKKDKIVLKSKDNREILGTRYLWKSWSKPDACLYNELDLPAMNFIDFRN